MTSLIVANFLGAALYAVLAAAGLQFVGLGNVNTESWGTMLYWAQNNEALSAGLPLWALAPGVMIAVLGSALALLNYAFDEVVEPGAAPGERDQGRVGREGSVAREHAAVLEVRDLKVAVHDLPAEPGPRPWRRLASTSRRGEFLAIVGESGCGKSTMLFSIAQLLTYPARRPGGSVKFDGRRPDHAVAPRSCASTAGATSRS